MKSCSLYLSVALTFVVLAFTYTTGFIIKGKVVDENGSPIPSASIHIKGTATGTSANVNGEFSLLVPGKEAILVISSTSFELAEIKVKDTSELLVTLKRATQTLNEVVITALAVKLRGRMAGANSWPGASAGYAAPGMIGNEHENVYHEVEGYAKKQDSSRRDNKNFNREAYDRIIENQFLKATDNPLSTFSIDVDAASYSNVRRMLNNDQLPPAGAVRIEEFINYFTYKYPQPKGVDPFSVNTEIAKCPWNEEHRIVSIGLQGKKVPTDNLPPSNLTFLIDVSGSMNAENKLPLVKASLKLLTEQLREQDKVSIVVYAGNAGLVLAPTSGKEKVKIREALEQLEAGGSTAGGEGIQLAYKTAKENFIKNGNNRVILCTDGDFNVGISSDDALEGLIEEQRKTGIFLTVLGYGTGNYQDAKMQKLADKGNGNHAYIDNANEAKKVLVNEFGGTLFTIAKDVKLQIEFNPEKVQGYRLIGYENRILAKEDFNNDKKDAGELGSGHTVTALYEIIPSGIKSNELDSVDNLRYQKPQKKNLATAFNGELLNIKLRYKQPGGDISILLQHPVLDRNTAIGSASDNLRFAAAVAQFGMLLRNSAYKGNSNFNGVQQLAANAIQQDEEGYRKEFIELVKKAEKLSKDVAVREVE